MLEKTKKNKTDKKGRDEVLRNDIRAAAIPSHPILYLGLTHHPKYLRNAHRR